MGSLKFTIELSAMQSVEYVFYTDFPSICRSFSPQSRKMRENAAPSSPSSSLAGPHKSSSYLCHYTSMNRGTELIYNSNKPMSDGEGVETLQNFPHFMKRDLNYNSRAENIILQCENASCISLNNLFLCAGHTK